MQLPGNHYHSAVVSRRFLSESLESWATQPGGRNR